MVVRELFCLKTMCNIIRQKKLINYIIRQKKLINYIIRQKKLINYITLLVYQ